MRLPTLKIVKAFCAKRRGLEACAILFQTTDEAFAMQCAPNEIAAAPYVTLNFLIATYMYIALKLESLVL